MLACSSTITSRPRRSASRPAARPAGPAPITTRSTRRVVAVVRFRPLPRFEPALSELVGDRPCDAHALLEGAPNERASARVTSDEDARPAEPLEPRADLLRCGRPRPVFERERAVRTGAEAGGGPAALFGSRHHGDVARHLEHVVRARIDACLAAETARSVDDRQPADTGCGGRLRLVARTFRALRAAASERDDQARKERAERQRRTAGNDAPEPLRRETRNECARPFDGGVPCRGTRAAALAGPPVLVEAHRDALRRRAPSRRSRQTPDRSHARGRDSVRRHLRSRAARRSASMPDGARPAPSCRAFARSPCRSESPYRRLRKRDRSRRGGRRDTCRRRARRSARARRERDVRRGADPWQPAQAPATRSPGVSWHAPHASSRWGRASGPGESKADGPPRKASKTTTLSAKASAAAPKARKRVTSLLSLATGAARRRRGAGGVTGALRQRAARARRERRRSSSRWNGSHARKSTRSQRRARSARISTAVRTSSSVPASRSLFRPPSTRSRRAPSAASSAPSVRPRSTSESVPSQVAAYGRSRRRTSCFFTAFAPLTAACRRSSSASRSSSSSSGKPLRRSMRDSRSGRIR